MKLIDKIMSENRVLVYPDDFFEFENSPEFNEIKNEIVEENKQKYLEVDYYTNTGSNKSVDISDLFELFTKFIIKYQFNELKIKKFDTYTNPRFFSSLPISKITVDGTANRIPDAIFTDMKCLKEVVLKEGLESIGEEAFVGCRFLKKLVVPSSIKQIGKNICGNCILLESIEIDENNKYYSSFNSNVIAKKDNMEIIQGCYKSTFNVNFKSIGFRAFWKFPMLKEIILPESLETISSEAFYDCISINKINFPKTLRTIGSLSFNNVSPKEVSFNGTIKEYLSIDGYKVFDSVCCLDGLSK